MSHSLKIADVSFKPRATWFRLKYTGILLTLICIIISKLLSTYPMWQGYYVHGLSLKGEPCEHLLGSWCFYTLFTIFFYNFT